MKLIIYFLRNVRKTAAGYLRARDWQTTSSFPCPYGVRPGADGRAFCFWFFCFISRPPTVPTHPVSFRRLIII